MPHPVLVGPRVKNPTHHVAFVDPTTGERRGIILCDANGRASARGLSNGVTPRTALKTSQGNQGYADFELPWTPIVQDNWQGGMGLARFERDTTRFLDSFRINATRPNKLYPASQERYTSGYRPTHFSLPGNVKWISLTPGSMRFLAVSFTTTSGPWWLEANWFLVRYKGKPGTLTVQVCDDNANNPGTVLKTRTLVYTSLEKLVSELHRFWGGDGASVASSTRYWLKIYGAATDGTSDHWEVGVKNAAGTTKKSSDGAAWTDATVDLYYRVHDHDAQYKHAAIPFTYKGVEYFITRADDGVTAPRLYMNGYRGAADSNAGVLGKLIDGTQAWPVDSLIGKVVQIIGGPGFEEEKNWRYITSNQATEASVYPPWLVAHTTLTEYVILDTDVWTEITGHGLTKPPTNVFIHREIVYFCQGDATNIRRMREYNNAGGWTRDWADDGTNKAMHMAYVEHSAGPKVWKSNNRDATSHVSVASADSQDWGTNLTFLVTPHRVGNDDDRIMGIGEGEQGGRVLFILKEGGPWTDDGTRASRIPLDEIATVKSSNNGRAHGRHDVYFYFSLLNGLQRYLDGVLTNMGPDKDEGLPSIRQGPVVDFLAVPGIILAAVDAGPAGISSIMAYNQAGWCEYYRAPVVGARIRSLGFQVVPGRPSRVWFSQENDILSLAWPSGGFDPLQEAGFPFTHESHLISSYKSAGLYELWKVYNSLKLITENLQEGSSTTPAVTIEADYKLDNETEWTPIEDVFKESPSQELNFKADLSVRGKQLSVRHRLLTEDATIPPVVTTEVIEAAARVPVTTILPLRYRVRKGNKNLRGLVDHDYDDPEAFNDWLLSKAENLIPLQIEAISTAWHNRIVFLDPTPLRADFSQVGKGADRERYIGELSVLVIRKGTKVYADPLA